MGKTGSGFKVYWKIRFVCMKGIKPQAEIWLESDIHIYSSVQVDNSWIHPPKSVQCCQHNACTFWHANDFTLVMHLIYKFSRTACTLEHTHAPINLNHLIHILPQDCLCTCTQLQIWIFPILHAYASCMSEWKVLRLTLLTQALYHLYIILVELLML